LTRSTLPKRISAVQTRQTFPFRHVAPVELPASLRVVT